MEELIQKHIHCRNKINEYTKLLDQNKEQIKKRLKDEPSGTTYEKNGYQVQLKTMQKSSITKKNVPSDIWEQYSVITPYEVLYVKKK